VETHDIVQKLGCLGLTKAKIRGSQFNDLTAGSQTSKRQRGI